MSIDSTHSQTPTQYSGETENRQEVVSDEKHKELNRARVRRSRQRRLGDAVYAEQERKRILAAVKNHLLSDDTYREENRRRARITAKKRWLTDEKYRELNIQRAKAFRQTHAERVRLNNKKWYSDERNKRIHCDKKNRGTRQTTGTDCARFIRLHSRVREHQMLNLHGGASFLDNKNTGSAAANCWLQVDYLILN